MSILNYVCHCLLTFFLILQRNVVLEDLSELLVLLCELTEDKSSTVSFDRVHPLLTAYVVTPKFWNRYKNIYYISVSLGEGEKQEDRK